MAGVEEGVVAEVVPRPVRAQAGTEVLEQEGVALGVVMEPVGRRVRGDRPVLVEEREAGREREVAGDRDLGERFLSGKGEP